ncbi:phosphate ABC transporter ATP-binding protein [Inediibacterium massiliense]|uniref:phosphate ABC transporter ATP-binding protein n=1 Tax=Inediibacterium massiliense TaxID=1658111 RepID=UPI0006B40B47|nr:phosphate ABC transporter ATP-binding protein [Inediibacterium massiliense]
MESILSIKDLCISYGTKKVLNKININIKKNKITSIIGPSGCGKSTLLKSINRMLEEEKEVFESGNIFLNDIDIKSIQKEKVRKNIGMVFQNPTPFPLSIYKNMTYGPIYYRMKDQEQLKCIVEEKLKIAGLYEEVKNDLKMNAIKLSGGQQQRLCIARALTVEPRILLLDEPCSALDIKNTQNIENMLKELTQNYTIVIVTHNLSQARRISDYTLFLLEGQVIEYKETKEIFENPKDLRTKQYIGGVFG